MTQISFGAPIWTTWTDRLPTRPLATDVFEDGAYHRPRSMALEFRNIEINTPGRVAFLNFDLDLADSFEAWERARLPVPNAFMQNPTNGHGNALYALATPVGISAFSRAAPIKLLVDIQRGMTRRLKADPAYSNRFAKNPCHPRWRTRWLSPRPFTLGELFEPLDRRDMRAPARRDEIGLGRNCDLFNELRQVAYREIVAFKRDGRAQGEWRDHLVNACRAMNLGFGMPLPISEVRSMAKSVAKWTWSRFSEERYSEIQARRGVARKSKQLVQTRSRIADLIACVSEPPQGPLNPDMATALLVPNGTGFPR